MASKKEIELVEIRPIETVETKVRVVGDTPLIVHAWSAKAKREMLEKQIGATKTTAREAKNPLEDFVSSMYWITPMPTEVTESAVTDAFARGARFGFPVTAFKQASISAAYRMGWMKDKMSGRGAFFLKSDVDGYYGGDLEVDLDKKKITIVPNAFKPEALVEIYSDTPVMREDMVRVGMGTADVRYRGQFDNWYADLTVCYDRNGKFSIEQILNMLNAGGFACGVGEWRPEKDGQYGMYHVEAI